MPAPTNQAEANAQALVESAKNTDLVSTDEAIETVNEEVDGVDVGALYEGLAPENAPDPEYTMEVAPEPYGDEIFDDAAAQKAAKSGEKYANATGPVDDVEAQLRAREADTVEELVADQDENPDFDPRDHSVAEVQDYLDENSDDADRVLELEIDGQARKGILEY